MKNLLDYNPETGIITWKVSRGGLRAGDVAGAPHSAGYVQIMVQGKKYLAHRLAWLLHYGKWPPEQIDHISGIKTDNRICNLRLASHTENQWNRSKQKTNTSGYKGVDFRKQRGRWAARCSLNGKQIHLGYYDNPEDAHRAYCKFAEKIHKDFFHA